MINNNSMWGQLMVFQYRYKFYLNANHFVIINGKRGEPHSHCFEFTIHVATPDTKTTAFNTIEKKVDLILQPYQNKLLNDVSPFDEVVPTLENICRYFRREIFNVLLPTGWVLICIEVSETPSRSFILTVDDLDFVADNITEYEFPYAIKEDDMHFDKNFDEFDYDVADIVKRWEDT